MTTVRDAETTTAAERLAEIGEILATGIRRLSLSQRKALDGSGANEAPCADEPQRSTTETAKDAT